MKNELNEFFLSIFFLPFVEMFSGNVYSVVEFHVPTSASSSLLHTLYYQVRAVATEQSNELVFSAV